MLSQWARELGEGNVSYVNFDEERLLGFSVSDAAYLLDTLVATFGDRRVIVLDEVQNVPEWERFVRRWMDQGYKLYITGSNAALLSRELGTRLTGRHIPIELFPFSYGEYLAWKGIPREEILKNNSTARALGNRELLAWLHSGGVPEHLQYPQLDLLRTLYDDVLYRDIVARHHVTDIAALREVALQLISSPSGLASFNKIKTRLGLGSTNTVRNYVQFLTDSWLLFPTTVFDPSVKRQQVAPKKVYVIDTGLATAVGYGAGDNTGHLLENAVFLEMRRRTNRLHYGLTANGFEIDLIAPELHMLVQVCLHLADPAVREREFRALRDAGNIIPNSQKIVLTMDNTTSIAAEAGLHVRSIAHWLLEK